MIRKKNKKSATQGYCDATYGILNDSPFIVEAFEQGVNCAIQQFLKDLWHPVSEKPKKGCVFLYKTMFKGYGVHKIIDRSEWKCIIKYQKATKWLYIDDLFSKKEGKS